MRYPIISAQGEMIGDCYKLLPYNVKGRVIGSYHGDAEPNNARFMCSIQRAPKRAQSDFSWDKICYCFKYKNDIDFSSNIQICRKLN